MLCSFLFLLLVLGEEILLSAPASVAGLDARAREDLAACGAGVTGCSRFCEAPFTGVVIAMPDILAFDLGGERGGEFNEADSDLSLFSSVSSDWT